MSDSESDSEDVEEYDSFAQPTLIDQLKKILDEYPDDGQIIKEIIQNADDAGAKCMKILYVGNEVNPKLNGEKKYRKFLRGPALVCYNDARFTTEDWTGIRTIYNSIKADDPLTVGRFGLGFKSVFHITDYPCIVSGDRILFLNPLERKAHKVCVTIQLKKLQRSKTIDIDDVLLALNDLFGFSVATLDEGVFPGTLFWFPLRSEATNLSANVYTENRVLGLFKAFINDAETSMLFLKGLQSIQLYCNIDANPDSPSAGERIDTSDINFGVKEDFFSVELLEQRDNACSSKASFLDQIKDLKGSIPEQTIHQALSCNICLKRRNRKKGHAISNQNWLILNLYPGEPMDENTKALIHDKNLCFSPLVSVATCKDGNKSLSEEKKGKIFCFQPLPEDRENITDLPVHINAFFALTQNRRNVRWPSAEQEQFKMNVPKPIEWNVTLTSDILPESYIKLIHAIIERSKHAQRDGYIAELVYSTLPDCEKVNPKWRPLADKVFDLLLDERFLFTKANGGQWISAEEAIFAPTDCIEAMRSLLLENNKNLVLTPRHILSAVDERLSPELVTKTSPEFIRQYMVEEQAYAFLSPSQKAQLLDYLYTSECKDQLHDLSLIPLMNGEFAAFGQEDTIYFENIDIVELFPGLEHNFVSTKIDDHTSRIFEEMSSQEDYQIRRLDVSGFHALILSLMEMEFESLLPPLKIDKGRSKQWKLWIEHIWKLILSKFPEEVDIFAQTDLPLFPVFSKRPWSKVHSFCLCPLSFRLLSSTDKDNKQIPTELCSAFELLSVNIVYRLPEWLNNKVAEQFVHACTGESLAALIGKLGEEDIANFNRLATDNQKRLLTVFLAQKVNEDMLSEKAKVSLSRVEMFKEKKSQCPDYKLVTAEESHGVLGCDDFPVPFPTPLLAVDDRNEEILANVLGVQMFSAKTMILKTFNIIETYSKDHIVLFMLWILNKQFHDKFDGVSDAAKEVAFLPVQNILCKAHNLFDPSDDLLVCLFEGFQVFPTDESFLKPKLLIALKDLGLKTRHCVSVENIYEICKRIHNLGSFKKSKKIGMHVLKFLNMDENEELLRESNVTNLKWVPVQDASTTTVLRYQKGKGVMVSPLEVRSSKYKHIVGSVSPLVDCGIYQQLASVFNWNKQPDINDVASQLLAIVKNYSTSKKAEFLPIILSIYNWFDLLKTPDDVKEALDETFIDMQTGYIWTGYGFQSSEDVVAQNYDGNLNLKPFLWFLPSEVFHMRQFFIELGCRDTIRTSDYVTVLDQIKQATDESAADGSGELLNLAINILGKLKDAIEHGTIDHNSTSTIYVPMQSVNGRFVMKPAAECTYGSRTESGEEEMTCVHEDVPQSIAKAVGVKSFKQQIMSELEGIEEWGQTEPLTRRLRNILKDGYVDGFSVPKELFQNADDAGASKLWILYDERENEHARTDLLSDTMSEVQGPALWIYNDAVFTDSDFRNITKLSGATKQPDASKIGKFGLGFCSVYNLTDVPSFISNESIVIFDPQTSFLGNALPGKSPGLRINLKIDKNRKMLKRLRNQFLPFENIFGCTRLYEMSRYDGTLFRLPLRTRKGQISDVIYRDDEIRTLLSKVKEYASNLLIFSQNVTEVKLFHLKDVDNPAEMKLAFSCKKELQPTMPRQISDKSILLEASILKNSDELQENPLKIIQNISIKAIDTNDKFSGTSTWFVSWSTGTQSASFELAKAEKGALPLAAIAVPFDCSGSTYTINNIENLPICFYKKSHFFCVLPLPVEHSFPFHINGHFSVSSDRRRLLTVGKEDKKSIYQDWNESLMRDAVVEALVHMLENVKALGSSTRDHFYKIWPQPSHVQTGEQHGLNSFLLKYFYIYIIEKDSRIFENCGPLYPLSECIFLDPDLRKLEIGNAAFDIFTKFERKKIAIDLPWQYYKCLYEADKGSIEPKTVTTEDFFLKYLLPNLSEMPMSSQACIDRRHTLLRHAIVMNNDTINRWLKINKCFPTKPTNEMKLPAEVVEERSEIGELFNESDGRFLIEDFRDIAPGILRDLGIIHDVLTDTLLVERAEKIEQMNQKCVSCTVILYNQLIKYIVRKEARHEEAWAHLRSIRFLPVAIRPPQWPSDWEADKLISATSKKAKLCKAHRGDKTVKKIVLERAPALYSSRLKDSVACCFLVFDSSILQQGDHVSKVEPILRNRLNMKGKQDIRPEMVLHQLNLFSQSFDASIRTFDAAYVDNVVSTIYQHLNAFKTLNTFEFPDEKIVWTSSVFTKPSKVAVFNHARDCSPYLFDLSKSPLSTCTKLIDALNIKQKFSLDDVLRTLSEICMSSNRIAVHAIDRTAVLNIVECLKLTLSFNSMTYKDLYDQRSCTIYAPDSDWVLRDAKTLCFDDDSGVDTSDTMTMVNEDLTISTAKAIGIKSKLTQNIQDSSDSVEFFQDEPLVTRLHNILADYPCDSGIFKELIQNADDAGAKEIHFLLDTCLYGPEVFDESFKQLQGPALCVYNDKPFTQNDLKGIQSLGKGSKGEDPSKTGQYGVGFNSVYNLTDAPSFLTKGPDIENGETLCIFDPMAIFLPRVFVSRDRPGRRFKDVKTIRTKHKDVLPPYNEDFFGLENQGTVFRFPLRSEEKGYTSDIKESSISAHQLKEIVLDFKLEASECLIFLKNMRRIKMTIKDGDTFSTEADIEAIITDKDHTARSSYFKRHAQMCRTFKQDRATIFSLPSLTKSYQISISEEDSLNKWSKMTDYMVVQTIGYMNHTPSTIIQDKCKNGELGLLPQGGVASVISIQKMDRFPRSQRKPNKSFCFLPLPGETGLPVHVHGHFALDHEGRRGLWKADHFDKTTCYKTLWNKSLVEGVICPAYLKLVEIMRIKLSSRLKKGNQLSLFAVVKDVIVEFNSFLPKKEDVLDGYWLLLMKCMYKQLVNQERKFLPSIRWTMDEKHTVWKACLSWIQLQRKQWEFPAYADDMAFSLDVGDDGQEDVGKRTECTLSNILSVSGMRIVSVPKAIRESLKAADCPIEPLNPKVVINFLCSHSQIKEGACLIKENALVTETVVQSVNHMCNIVKYCIKEEKFFIEHIHKLPILVSSDSVVRVATKEKPLYVTKYNDFFENEKDKFLCLKMTEVILKKQKEFLQTTELRPFMMTDFKKLLAVSSYQFLIKTEVFKWDLNHPTKEWIVKIWKFFRDEVIDKQSEDKQIKESTQMNGLLKLLDDVALIPARRTMANDPDNCYLVSPCKMGYMIDLTHFQTGTLKNALQKLNLLAVDTDTGKDVQRILNEIAQGIANSKSPVKVVKCLHLNKVRISEAELSTEDAVAVLNYIAENYGNLNDVNRMVRELPLFINHDNKLVSLDGYTKCVALESDKLPVNGLDELSKEKRMTFLKTWNQITKLYETLGVLTNSLEDIYIEFIIPNQHIMQRDDFYKHLEYISSSLLMLNKYIDTDLAGKKKIITLLTACRFIQIRQERFVNVSDFFNPRVKVFNLFCQKEELLPDCFNKDVYIRLFELLGMKSKMTIALFERFAKEISVKGKQNKISQSLRNQSGRLLKVFMEMQTEIDKEIGFKTLAQVPFIIPVKVPEQYTRLCEQFLKEDRMVSFSESVFYEQLELAWTACPVLPKDLKVHANIKTKLEAKASVLVKNFVGHCQNVGHKLYSLLEKPTDKPMRDTIESVLIRIYENLLRLKTDRIVEAEKLKQLSSVPLVCFRDKLSIHVRKATDVVIECSTGEEVPPYLNKMPIALGKYSEVFQDIGASKKPSVLSYISVLHGLKDKCNNEKMLKPDLLIARAAISNMLTHDPKEISELVTDKYVLYLPTQMLKMENARSVIICDNNYLRKRLDKKCNINYFLGLDKLEIKHVDVQKFLDFFLEIPDHLQPERLSQIVEEIIDPATFKEKSDSRARNFESFIKSSQFSRGLIRLVKHAYSDEKKTWDSTMETTIKQKLSQIRLVSVSEMKTTLHVKTYANDKYGNSTKVLHTDETKTTHVEETGSLTKVFVETGLSNEWRDDLNKSIVQYMNKVLKSCLKDELFVLFLDFIKHIDQPTGIENMLDKKKIVSHTFTSFEEPSIFPKPGTPVPPEFHKFLDNDYGVFYKYDYNCVAFEMFDPLLHADNSDEMASFVYARILRKVEEKIGNPLFDIYEIDVGENDPINVSAFRLYKFVRKVSTGTEIVVYERQGNNAEDDRSIPTGKESKEKELSIHVVCKEIKDTLIEAFRKDTATRKSIVKRLWIRWHPDKNLDNDKFCTKVFQYIQQCIEQLEKGKTPADYSDGAGGPDASRDDTGGSPSRPRGPSYRWRRRTGGDSSDYWEKFWEDFVESMKRKRERDRSRDSSKRPEDYWEFPSAEREPCPWPFEARKWQRQARADFQFAENCLKGTIVSSYNWICYMCHQAAEKSLRAAWFAKDFNKRPADSTTDLSTLARGLVDTLHERAVQITRITKDRRRMTYPSTFQEDIPADRYTAGDAEMVYEYTRQLIQLVTDFYVKV